MSNNNHKYKMLIADDDEGSLNYLKMEFYKEYMVLLAKDSNEALEELFKPENNDITIIIADKKMPRASGFDFLRESKKQFPHAIRVMITAYPEINDVELLINDIGIDLFYSKTVIETKIEDFKQRLKKAIAKYELYKEMDYAYNIYKRDIARKNQ